MNVHKLIDELSCVKAVSLRGLCLPKESEDIQSAIMFDLGSSDDFKQLVLMSSRDVFSHRLARPPFENVCFEIKRPDAVIYWFHCINTQQATHIYKYGFNQTEDEFGYFGELVMYHGTPKISDDYIVRPDGTKTIWWQMNEKEVETYRGHMAIFCAFEVMACSNVVFQPVKAPKHANRKRARRNKTKLYDYHTLVVRLPNERTEPAIQATNTSRAGPRLHLRRGHIRNLPNGEKIWIQPAIVGDKKSGIAHKDYRITH